MKFLCIAALTLMVFISGCATRPTYDSAYYHRVANTPIYCSGTDDCEVKWGRAILWISDNSHWKIRNQSDSLITTEGPFDTVYAAYSVNKIPFGGGKYQIRMQAGSGNPFGCVPSVVELKADFVEFVSQENFEKLRKYEVDYSAEPINLTPVDESEIKEISPKNIIVKFDSIKIYGKPGFVDEVISSVNKSHKLTAIAENNGWYKVKIEDGTEGWVAKSWVE